MIWQPRGAAATRVVTFAGPRAGGVGFAGFACGAAFAIVTGIASVRHAPLHPARGGVPRRPGGRIGS